MVIQRFTDLNAWQEAHQFLLQVYKATKKFPPDERYGLTDQIRRAILSVESNIAEGFRRYHYKERTKFYYDARGSLAEVQTQLITAKDLGYLNGEFEELWHQSEIVDRLLNGLINSTKKRSEN